MPATAVVPTPNRIGLQDPQVRRVLREGRADILFLVAADLQMRRTKAVEKPDRLHKRPLAHASKHILPGCGPSTSNRGKGAESLYETQNPGRDRLQLAMKSMV